MASQAVALPLPSPFPPQASSSDALLKTSLYVGDLDPGVTETDLIVAFSEMGPVVSVRLCRDRVSHKSLRYGYVNFVFPSHAAKALACLNHKDLKGKRMRIMWCQRDPLTRKSGVGNLFVKNLDCSITSARLQGIFCKFGTILSCKVAEENGKSKCFGFVQFDCDDSAIAAINALHGTIVEGKELYVSKFVNRSIRKNTCQEPQFTNLYVKNLDANVTEKDLEEKFSEYGNICNILIVKDADGKSMGFGFVNFELHEDAEKAVGAMNGALLGSKELFVGKALKKSERGGTLEGQTEKPNASNLYVKNLAASVDDKSLKGLFSFFGEVTSAKVMRYSDGVSKGFGFVSFSIPEEAQNAMDTLAGTVFHGKNLYVAIAQRKDERLRELQQYYEDNPEQSFYSSNVKVHTSLQPNYSCPFYPAPVAASSIICRYPAYSVGGEGARYPPLGTRTYQRVLSAYEPTGELGKGTYKEFHVPMKNLNTTALPTKLSKNQLVSWNKTSVAASTSSRPYASAKGPNSVKYLSKCQGLQEPRITGMLLEMDDPDVRKLLNSSKSLAVQVDKAVHVMKNANSCTNQDR